MKILYVIHQFFPDFQSGTEQVTRHIAHMMQNDANKVKIVAYDPLRHENASKRFGTIRYKEYVYQGLPVTSFYIEDEPVDLCTSLSNEIVENFAEYIIRTEKPDIIHIFHPMRVAAFTNAAQRLDIPYMITLTDLMFLCPRVVMRTLYGELCTGAKHGAVCDHKCSDAVPAGGAKRFAIAEGILKGAKKVFAPSEFIVNAINEEFPDIPVVQIKHGMPYGNLALKDSAQDRNGKVVFGYMGTMLEHKGLHTVIDAFSKIKQDNAYLKVYGKLTEYGEHQLKRMKNDSRVQYCGTYNASEINMAYNEIDVLVIPSVCYESYSLVKHEAIMRGIPVIVSRIGALPEGLRNGENGYWYTPGNAEELAAIISNIADAPEKLMQVQENMKEYVVPSIEQEAYAYWTVYRTVLNK